ncbi:MAG: glycoside hydrolase family 30 protein [Solirubrobacteraceae bacterium]
MVGVLVVGIGDALCVGPASGGVGAGSDRVALGAGGLSVAEREAITIKSVNAAGAGSLGLIVSVTFGGDVERLLGQGGLGRSLLALVLMSSSAGRAPIGLVDQGGGFAPAAYPVIEGHGRRVTARRGSLEVFSPERVMAITPARRVWVLREGNRVVFYLAGAWVSHVAKIRLKVFATSPIGPGPLTVAGWRRVFNQRPTDRAVLSVDATALSSGQLNALRGELSDLLSFGVEPELRYQDQTRTGLKAAIDDYQKLRRVINSVPSLRRLRRGDLVNDLGNTVARIAHLKAEIVNAENLIAQVGALITGCAAPSPGPVAPRPSPAAPIVVVQTDPALCQALTPETGPALATVPPKRVPLIDVNDQLRYQQFSGLGAAMTDTSAWLIYDQLPAPVRLSLMQDLFGLAGIHLNFLRVPVAASDFTVGAQPYSYDDVIAGQSDASLTQFSIAHDLQYIIPTLRQALATNPGVEILASPWSPPAWMKSNDLLGNVKGQGTLLPSAYGPYASYLVKFIEAYAADGVPIDAITPQNEPGSAPPGTPYPGLTLPEADEANFISQDLQPALAVAGLHPKIYANDLSWDALAYADPLASGPVAGDLSGIAWHCYYGLPSVMSQLHQAAPGLDQIVDECSPEIEPFATPEYLISALRNWATVAAVWNVALDPRGGPKQAANGCPGCNGLVTIDEQAHTLSFGPEYFQLGQISAYVQPGATRIDSANFLTYGTDSANRETVSGGLDDVAFLNPDGTKVLVAYNSSTAAIPFGVESDGRYFTYTIHARAMTTFTWR